MDHPGPARRSPGSSGRENPLATPAMAASLAIVLIALAAAIVLIPGLLPGTSAPPTPGASTGAPSPTPAGSPTAAPLPSFIRPTPTPAPTFMSYVVRAGDSLTSIARRFETTPRSVAWWNRGAYPSLDPESAGYDPNHIQPGWVLVLIPGVKVDEANPPTPSPGPPTPSPGPPTPSPGPPTAGAGG